MAEIIDLTWPLRDGLATYPGGGRVAVLPKWDHGWSAPRYEPPTQGTAERIVVLDEHVGTHMDAPLHFIAGAAGIDEIPLTTVIGTAVPFSLAHKPLEAEVTVEMATRYLEEHGLSVEPGDCVLFHLWNGRRDDPARHRAGALSLDLTRWLIGRGVKLVGLDLASVDTQGSRSFPCHVELLSRGIPIVENLVDLHRLPPRKVGFQALPLPLVGGTGSPVRAFATL